MKLVFPFTIEDSLAFHRWYMESRPNYKNQILGGRIMCAAPIIAPLLICALVSREWGNQFMWKMLVILALAAFIINFFSFPKTLHRTNETSLKMLYQDRKCGWNFCKTSTEVLGDKLITKSERGEVTYSLSLVTEVVETPAYVFIGRGVLYDIIPRASIEEGDLDQFVRELKSKVPPASDLPVAPVASLPAKANDHSVQPGVWMFAASGLCAFGSVIPAVKFVSKIKVAGGCEEKFNLFSLDPLCSDVAFAAFSVLGLLALSAVLFVTSLVMIYKNWKKERAKGTE